MMANIVSAEDILGGGGEPYLSLEDKAALHNAQTAFYMVNAVAEREGTYGPQTIFTIKAKGMEPSMLAFQASASRISQARNVLNAIAQGADAIGPCYLGRWEANGKSGWQITFNPTTPMTIPATQQQAAQAATAERVAAVDTAIGGDSDIPFAPSFI
jgi:hypothetical protein